MGNAAVNFFEKPELVNKYMSDPKRVKNLKPDFADPLMNAKLNGMGGSHQIETPSKSKVSDYRGISSKTKSVKTKTITRTVSVETTVSSDNSSESEGPRKPTVFSILQEKVASSSVDPLKRKMAELLEQRLQDSDDGSSGGESEEEASKKRRKSSTVPRGRGGRGGRGRGGRGRGK